MKALKKCKWEVNIAKDTFGDVIYWWTKNSTIKIESGKTYRSIKSAKRNWEKFAKVNSIKNWKYV